MEFYWPNCVKPQWILHITLSYGKASFMDFCFISWVKNLFLILFFLFFTVKCGLFINSYRKHLSVSSGLRDLEIFQILKTLRLQDYLHRTSHISVQQGAEPVQYKMYLQTIQMYLLCCHLTPRGYYLIAFSDFFTLQSVIFHVLTPLCFTIHKRPTVCLCWWNFIVKSKQEQVIYSNFNINITINFHS